MKNDNNLSEKQLPTPVLDPSRRPSGRPEFECGKAAQVGGDSATKGSDSIPFSGIPSSSAGAGAVKKKSTKLTRAQLIGIEAQLTARDHAVLQAIKKYRFLTSDQIGRLYMTDCSMLSLDEAIKQAEIIIRDFLKQEILDIQASGHVNMFDLKAVQQFALEQGTVELANFIENHPERYREFITTGNESFLTVKLKIGEPVACKRVGLLPRERRQNVNH